MKTHGGVKGDRKEKVQLARARNKVLAMMGYLRYEMMSLIFCFNPDDEKSMKIKYLSDFIKNEPFLGKLLNDCKSAMEKTNLELNKCYKYCFEFDTNNMIIRNWHLQKIYLTTNITFFRLNSIIQKVQVFGNIEKSKLEREIHIQKLVKLA